MNRPLRKPIFFLISIMILLTIACQGLTSIPEIAPTIDREAIVADVVATVEAQMPEPQTAVVPPAATPTITMAQLPAVDLDLQNLLINVYSRANPSVVHIFVFDEIEEATLPLGTGSGFVFDTEGHIVTNNHVVAEGDRFEVAFPDGSHETATLVGTDVDSDLGVIKVENLPETIQPLSLGDSKQLQVGQFVIAIGNPFGEAGSMSIGVISGLGRTLESQRIADGGGRYSLPEVIQTDAAINPGNSGGPLLNLDGLVVGVNSAISTLTGENSGVGFSIPVNAVRKIVPKLITDNAYTYPYMGIRMLSLDLELQELFDLPQTSGTYVTDVTENSPAEEAGLIGAGGDGPGGDLIVAIDGQQVTMTDDLIAYLVFETDVGQVVDLTILRDGERINLPLTLGERP